jgi:hypothetical protein
MNSIWRAVETTGRDRRRGFSARASLAVASVCTFREEPKAAMALSWIHPNPVDAVVQKGVQRPLKLRPARASSPTSASR